MMNPLIVFRLYNSESTNAVMQSIHLDIHKSPNHEYDRSLIIGSGVNALLLYEKRLATKLVPMRFKVEGLERYSFT